MKIVVNTISTKKGSGGAFQIAYNFILATLKYPIDDIEWIYFASEDVDSTIGNLFVGDSNYFVFPTQPDLKESYLQVKKRLVDIEDKIKPDLIYTISSPCYFTFKTLEVMRFANAWVTNPNKFAWNSLSFSGKIKMYLYCLNQRLMLRKAKYIITQSETVKQGLLKITKLNDERINVVPNVLPETFLSFPINKEIDSDWIDIVSVAAPNPHKNIEIIIDVLNVLRDKYNISNVRFHLTLPEDTLIYKKIYNRAQNYNLLGNIVNHGRCTQKELAEIYCKCSICFLPTLLETFSASSLEAMFFNLNIVASDFLFNREIIDDSGLYFEPMNAVDAADKIYSLIDNKDLCSDLKNKMESRLLKYNSYKNHFDLIVGFLKKVEYEKNS